MPARQFQVVDVDFGQMQRQRRRRHFRRQKMAFHGFDDVLVQQLHVRRHDRRREADRVGEGRQLGR